MRWHRANEVQKPKPENTDMSQDYTQQEPESERKIEGAVDQPRLVLPLPWGSFLSEQLYKWKTGEIECGCREMAIHVRRIVEEEIVRRIVEEEIAKGSSSGKNVQAVAPGRNKTMQTRKTTATLGKEHPFDGCAQVLMLLWCLATSGAIIAIVWTITRVGL